MSSNFFHAIKVRYRDRLHRKSVFCSFSYGILVILYILIFFYSNAGIYIQSVNDSTILSFVTVFSLFLRCSSIVRTGIRNLIEFAFVTSILTFHSVLSKYLNLLLFYGKIVKNISIIYQSNTFMFLLYQLLNL